LGQSLVDLAETLEDLLGVPALCLDRVQRVLIMLPFLFEPVVLGLQFRCGFTLFPQLLAGGPLCFAFLLEVAGRYSKLTRPA